MQRQTETPANAIRRAKEFGTRVVRKLKELPEEKTILVDFTKISTRGTRRRAMLLECKAECKKMGLTWRMAKWIVKNKMRVKPTLNLMHRELVKEQPC